MDLVIVGGGPGLTNSSKYKSNVNVNVVSVFVKYNSYLRWYSLVDDCIKFVKREIRRGNKYDAVIMDPPSYGRGPDGEVWKLEQQLTELLTETGKLLSDNAEFFFLNSYTGGLSPSILNYMVSRYVIKNRPGAVATDEIGLYVTDKKISLPAGNTTVWIRENG